MTSCLQTPPLHKVHKAHKHTKTFYLTTFIWKSESRHYWGFCRTKQSANDDGRPVDSISSGNPNSRAFWIMHLICTSVPQWPFSSEDTGFMNKLWSDVMRATHDQTHGAVDARVESRRCLFLACWCKERIKPNMVLWVPSKSPWDGWSRSLWICRGPLGVGLQLQG